MGVSEAHLSRIGGKATIHWRGARIAAFAAATVLATAALPAEPRQADTTPPSVAFTAYPPAFVGTPTVTYEWSPPTDNVGVTYFHLRLGSTSSNTANIGDIDVLGETSYNYTATGHGQRVYADLLVRDAANNERLVEGTSVRFDFEPPTVSVPTGPASGYSPQMARVTWSMSDQYAGVGPAFLDLGSAAGLADYGTLDVTSRQETTYDAAAFLPSGQVHGAEIYYQLRASDKVGNQTTVQNSQPTTIDIIPPVAPEITASVFGTNITFSWDGATDETMLESLRLTVVRAPPSSGTIYAQNVEQPGSRQFGLTDLSITLSAQIKATDKAGNVSLSNVVIAGPDVQPPSVEFDIVGRSQTLADEVSILTRFNERLNEPLTADHISLLGMPGTFSIVDISTPTENESEYDVRIVPDDPDADGTMAFEIAPGLLDRAGNAFAGATSPTVTFFHRALAIGSAQADCGDEFSVPVEIINGEAMDSFGFDLEFDNGCATFLGADPGAAISSGWTFEARQDSPSKLIIGGFRTTGSAPISGDAEIATLHFRFVRANESCATLVEPGALVDGIAGYTIIDGLAECGNGPGPLAGDSNGDFAVTPADAREAFLCFILQACASGISEDRAEIAPDNGDGCAGMADGDDTLDPDDAQRIFEIFLGGEQTCE